jgi:hypothetical protein
MEGKMSRLMSDPREIWFRRFGRWRSLPVHWKGFALLLGGIGIVVAGAFAGETLADRSSTLSGASYAAAVVAFLVFFVVADRHTG